MFEFVKGFSESEEYLNLVEISNKRKLELFGDENKLTYYQLRKRLKKLGSDLEVHHRVPRYRLKGIELKIVNSGANLLLLTPYEHLLAHYYLTKFEIGKYRSSALMTFIQLSSFKLKDFIEATEDEVKEVIAAAAEARKNYFGSTRHIEGSKTAGKISGAKRKERFKNDPEFADYIKLKLHNLDDSKKERRIESYKNTIDSIPHWKRPGSEKYIERQLWEFSKFAFIANRYSVSYKKLARFLNVDHDRILHVMRVFKTMYNDLKEFTEWRFYNDFCKDFPGFEDVDEEKLKLYFTKPWKTGNDSWFHVDIIFHKSRNTEGRLTVEDLYSFTNVNSRDTLLKWLYSEEVQALEAFEDWNHYDLWTEYRQEIHDHSDWRGGCKVCNRKPKRR